MQKEGYEENVAVGSTSSSSAQPSQPRAAPFPQPLSPLAEPPRPRGGGYLPTEPYAPGLGSRDLDPFAGFSGPGGLRLPGSGNYGAPPGFGGGGMFMGPNDAIFGRVRDPYGGQPSFPRGSFPQGPLAGPGGERLPPGSIPPGARFDPIVPGTPPGSEGGRPWLPPGSIQPGLGPRPSGSGIGGIGGRGTGGGPGRTWP